jgi:predicted ATPase/DNA-binding CsgD family transcriptional regulator
VQGSTRLLTLVGPAGVGKTRLGLRLAALVSETYRDGVWFVDLASVCDPIMLTHAVAQVVGVRGEPGQSSLETLVQRLRSRHALLIFDNCERLLNACAQLVVTLLGACPQMHFLAISREPLETAGDTIWRVPPLSLPVARSADRAQVAASDAAQLFLVRVRAHNERFQVTGANSAEIGALCRQLDGLPLALELVAARVRNMANPNVTTPLPLGRPAGATHGRAGPRRKRTLRRTLDWSHRHLSEPERVLFRRLGVFAGSWDLPAAELVCSDDRLSVVEVARGLDQLVAGSLVVVDSHHEPMRYRFLDTIRDYALEQLQASAESDAFFQRQLGYLVSIAEQHRPEELNANHAALLERELDNLRSAMARALEEGESEPVLRLATAASSLWYLRGYYAEGCGWLERGLALAVHRHTATRARAIAWLGQLLQLRGEYSAAERSITDALARQRTLGDAVGCALSVGMLGQLALMRGDLVRARGLCSEAAERFSELAHPSSVASRMQSAVIAVELGELEHAHAIIARCDAQGLDLSPPIAAWLVFLKARVAEASGDSTLARALLVDTLQRSRALPEQQAIMSALVELGHVEVDRQATASALASFVEAVELAYGAGDRILLVRALEGLARCSVADRPAAATRLAGAAAGLRLRMGATPWPSDCRRQAAWLPEVVRGFRSRHRRSMWAAGRADSLDDVVALARSLTAGNASMSRADQLTEREREVVALLARALTNQQIAAELTISPATARTHVEHVLTKLGLHTRAQVAVWANQTGGVRPPKRSPSRTPAAGH